MTKTDLPIKTVLLSVTDKSGLIAFAQGLLDAHPSIKMIASGGTAKVLEEAGITITPLEKYTGFPECFGGRVKTLHPHIEGGILYKRGIHDEEAKTLGILPIDLVVCNLYRFQEAIDKGLLTEDLIEQMDIGGSTLIRSALKNYRYVSIVTDPADYPELLQEIKEHHGATTLATREKLAQKAAILSADYEASIAEELTKRFTKEETYRPTLRNGRKLRYGENPDQEAWVYQFDKEEGIAKSTVLAGKAPSYNNYEDATAAHAASDELLSLGFQKGVAIIKHGSLCGYATGPTLEESFERAFEGDSKSAFGSVVSFTETVESSLVPHLKGKFVEVLIAPDFSEDFLHWAKEKRPNLRLIKNIPQKNNQSYIHKNVSGGLLVQTKKCLQGISLEKLLSPAELREKRVGVVTKKQPKETEGAKVLFSIAAVNFSKSNAIVIVREWSAGYYQLLGVGSGQPNRVDSLQRLAIPKALENLEREGKGQEALAECVLASDGFFPFDDSIRYAAQFGIQYCVQPGGSVRDQEVVEAADELDICMIFTGERYFTH